MSIYVAHCRKKNASNDIVKTNENRGLWCMFAQVVHGETICFRGQEVKGQGQVRLKTYLEAA